jgi:DNA-binding Xre family transcriptional regulator
MGTLPVSVISVSAQGAWASYFQSRPLKNPLVIDSQPVGGLDFYYTPSGILRGTTPLRHNYPQYNFYKEVSTMTALKRIRIQRGIPLYVLARRARVSLGTLTAWEKHGCPPVRIEPVQRVAAVLGVEPEELLEPVKEAQP